MPDRPPKRADGRRNGAYAAHYDDVNTALADLDAVEQLHDEQMIGKSDAAVIENEGRKAQIVKRADHPRMRVIPELLGSGNLPSNDLKRIAEKLPAGKAELIVVGETTLEKGFDGAVTSASSVVKRDFSAAIDKLSEEMKAGLKSLSRSRRRRRPGAKRARTPWWEVPGTSRDLPPALGAASEATPTPTRRWRPGGDHGAPRCRAPSCERPG